MIRKVRCVSFFLLLSLLAGCGSSSDFVATGVNPPVQLDPEPQPTTGPDPAPPTAVNDTVQALGNATLNQSAANGVLVNDTLNGATVSTFDSTTTRGGTVVLSSDGSFIYTPPFGFTGTDTFTYTLQNVDGASTATVTLDIPNQGFFVNNQVMPGGNGSQATPFDDIADALNAASSGDIIYVFAGDGSAYTTDPINLPDGVSLIGESSGLVLGQQIEPVGTAPLLVTTVNLGDGNTVSGFTFGDNGTNSIVGNGVSGALISGNTFNDPVFRGLILTDISGDWVIEGNAFNGTQTQHIDLTNISGNITVERNIFGATDDRGVELDVDETLAGDMTFIIRANTWNDESSVNCEEAVLIRIDNLPLDLTVIYEDNVLNGSDTSSFAWSEGLNIQTREAVNITCRAATNVLDNLGEDGFALDSIRGNATLEILDNTITNCRAQGIEIVCSSNETSVTAQSVTIQNNVIGLTGQRGIDLLLPFQGLGRTVTGLVSSNQISNCGTDGIVVRGGESANTNAAIAIRDNTISQVGEQSLEVDIDSATVCLDITDNVVGAGMAFIETVTGTINVERLDALTGGPLDTVNTFFAGTVSTSGNVNAVNGGFCSIP